MKCLVAFQKKPIPSGPVIEIFFFPASAVVRHRPENLVSKVK